MAYTTQYIGSRYVPLFAEPAEWDSTRTYEPLTIVMHDGNSYTSRQYVPVGIEITNEKFWALTGNYNAQVEHYRNEVTRYKGIIDGTVVPAVNKNTSDIASLTNNVNGTIVPSVNKNTGDIARLTNNVNGTIVPVVNKNTDDIASLIRSSVKKIDNVANMVADENISVGDIVKTKGFYEPNDKGSSYYFITDEDITPNGFDSFQCRNGIAKLMQTGTIYLEQLGFNKSTGNDLLSYAFNNYDVDGNGNNINVSSTITISEPHRIENCNFTMMFTPTEQLTYILNFHADAYVKNCKFKYHEAAGLNAGAILIQQVNANISNCSFEGFAFGITKGYTSENIVTDFYANNIKSKNCPCVIHLANCRANISNVIANKAFKRELLSHVFYIRQDVNANFNNIYVSDYDGSVFHCNRYVNNVPIPEFNESEPHKSFINATNVIAINTPRLIDLNSWCDAILTNCTANTEIPGRASIEFRDGLGSIKICNSSIHSIASVGTNPIPSLKRSIYVSNCNIASRIYDDPITKAETMFVIDGNNLGDSIMINKSNAIVINNIMNQDTLNKDTPVVKAYGEGETIFVNNNIYEPIKNKTMPLVYMSPESKNNRCIITNNVVYSSTVVNDMGTTNTIKENNNYSFI